MTVKLLVVSTAKNTNRILARMQEIAGAGLEVVLHIGREDDDFKSTSISRMKLKTGTKGHIMDDRPYSGAARPLFQSPDYFRFRDVFSDHLNRRSERYHYRSHDLVSQQDFHDYYHVISDALADEIRASGATHCLFFNVPHLGYDTIMYQLAASMRLPITIVTQSLFPSRFFSMRDPADYGAFTGDPGAAPYAIEKGSKPDLFYMKGIGQEPEPGGRVSAQAMLQLATFLLMKRPRKALNPFYVWKTLSHMQRIYGAFPKWRDPFARFFHENELAYFDHLVTSEDQPVDMTGDYVYFPLQLQPEMTTSSLGGRFRDQAYAIERLSEILPDGVRILVKENPKQGAYMRGPLFFHRVRRIPAVTVLPSWADTHALTANARFVAAITGTVGWEAIRAGIPALVFGKAWYRKLPGVHEFRDDITYAEITGGAIDHEALQAAVGGLLARAHAGVVDRHYTAIADAYEEATNDDHVAGVILDLLAGAQTTFTPEPPARPAGACQPAAEMAAP